MGTLTRGNGSTYFASLAAAGKMHADVASALDTELNDIVSTSNSIDNANIAATPKIAGAKIDLTGSGYLELAGTSNMTGTIKHAFDGVFRTMRAVGNGQIREYRGSDGAIWGVSYNTYWTGSAWNGRDVTDICAVLKMESDGLHYYHAVSGASGTVPTFTEVLHAGTGGLELVSFKNDIITPSKLAPAAGETVLKVFNLATARTFTAGTRGAWQYLKDVDIYHPGKYSISFRAQKNSDDICQAQLHINGVAAGTLRTISATSPSWDTWTEDITITAVNDNIQLGVKIVSGVGTDTITVDSFEGDLYLYANTTIADADI